MSIWYFVIGFISSLVVVALIQTLRFLRSHRIVITKINKSELGHQALAEPGVAQSTELAAVEPAPAGELASVADSALALEARLIKREVEVAEPLDMAAFGRRLTHSKNPIAELQDFMSKTREQQSKLEIQAYCASQDDVAASDNDSELVAPDELSLYLCRGLEEAGIFDEGAKFGSLTCVRPSRSKSFYLRINDETIAWGDMLRLVAIEGALNRALFAWEHLVRDAEEGAPAPSQDEIYQFNQALANSITAQVGNTPIAHASMSDIYGEWAVRQALASGIESFRLPLRLECTFRLNLMAGDAAIVAQYIPAPAHSASVYSEDLGRVIDVSSSMRERAAATYAMRCALLLASHAFRCSKRLCHVFVAFTMDTPAKHTCVLSGDIAREQLREYDLSASFDPEQVCRELGVHFELKDGALQEIEQGFSLDSERFCPRSRYEAVDLSERILPSFEAELLGARSVRDLAINENAHRDAVAQQLVRMLTGSTTKDVQRILEITQNDKDPSVQDAGRRLAVQLIDGGLATNDAYALVQEFVFGDELTHACDKALALLNEGDARGASQVLTDVLAPLDGLDVYTDTSEVAWREFTSYVGRALYNRLYGQEGIEVRLVPDAYYSAQLLQASAQLMLGNIDMALGFAERACDLNPFDMSGRMRLVHCYERKGDLERACQEIGKFLETAFDPNAIAICYYRLGFLYWQLGNIKLADACYQRALSMRSASIGPAMLELQMMRIMTQSKPLKPERVEQVLQDANIALAPTEQVTDILIGAAQAATDAEVFPVARSFATLLGSLSGDDVMHDIASSIELDPDW